MERVKLKIEGMSCDHCLRAVSDTLDELPGVAVDDVALGAATVRYDPERSSPETIALAVRDAGYPAEPHTA